MSGLIKDFHCKLDFNLKWLIEIPLATLPEKSIFETNSHFFCKQKKKDRIFNRRQSSRQKNF